MTRKLKLVKGESGDSLVEVLLSLSVLSLVVFISWSIVNRAANINLAARQRVVMVNALREQAEILQAHYSANENSRSAIVASDMMPPAGAIPVLGGDGESHSVFSSATHLPSNPCSAKNDAGVPMPVSAFHYGEDASMVTGILSNVGGYENAYLWIQKRVSWQTTPVQAAGKYVDFYVRACWSSTGAVQSEDNSHFVVRFNR